MFLFLGACGTEDAEVDDRAATVGDQPLHVMERLEEKFEVTYQPGTVIVSNDAMRYMARPVADSEQLIFALDAEPHLDLVEGAVTIFPMAALVRVRSWETTQDSIIVHTAPAALTEAIKDADIESVVEIGWKQLVTQVASPESGIRFELVPTAHADDAVGELAGSISQSFEFKGVKLKFTLTPKSLDRLEYEITLGVDKTMWRKSITPQDFKRQHPTSYLNGDEFQPVAADESYGDNLRGTSSSTDYGVPEPPPDGGSSGDRDVGTGGGGETTARMEGAIGIAKASGHISGFQQWFDLEISDGVPRDVYIDFKALSGELKLEAATLAGIVSTMEMTIPVEYVITVPLGGVIPLTITVGAEISFRPIVERGTSGSSKLCMVFEYEGSTGLRYSNGSFSNESSFRKRAATLCSGDETVSAGRLTVAMGTTVKVPKFTVSLFRLPIATSIYFMADGVTSFEPGIASAMQACQAGKQHLAVIAQATMKIFELIDTEVHAKLWDLEREWTCDGKVIQRTFDKAGGQQESSG